jgi:hypothetical protein
MLSILKKKYGISRQKGGRPPKLTVEDKLYVTLKCLREYRTTGSIAAEYRVCKGTVFQSVQWVEDTPAEDGVFDLRGKRNLKENRTRSGMSWLVYGKSGKPP